MDDKYVVFNKQDFEKWYGGTHHVSEPVPIPDAVVIRKQDVFAGPALHAYAASIAVATRMTEDPEVRSQLQEISDYFHEAALDADASNQRVPN